MIEQMFHDPDIFYRGLFWLIGAIVVSMCLVIHELLQEN